MIAAEYVPGASARQLKVLRCLVGFYGAPLATEAQQRLKACDALLETFAQRIFKSHDENR